MGRAEDIFQRMRDGGLDAINEFYFARVVEELFLEFKGSGDRGTGRALVEADNKNFARAISGFGNAEGGVVIWGIDERALDGNPTNTPSPLANAIQFRANLEGATSRLTLPSHPGVQNFVVRTGAGSDGYVVTLIPKAEFAPIRSVVKGANDYYLRAGDSFQSVTHGSLAGMFGRRSSGLLRARLSGEPIRNPTPPEKQVVISIRLEVENAGPAIVDRCFVSVRSLESHKSIRMVLQAIDQKLFDVKSSTELNFQAIARPEISIAPGGRENVKLGLQSKGSLNLRVKYNRSSRNNWCSYLRPWLTG